MVSGSRVISPNQHRPLNSTSLVETKSDTRKAKLLQMHKPFSVRSLSALSLLYRCFPLRLLTPLPLSFGVCNPPRASSSFSVASFDSCSFQLPTYTQSTLFIAKTSFCLFLFLLVHPFLSFSFPLCFSLSFSSFLCVVQGRSASLLAFFFSPFLYIRKTSCLKFLFYHSIPD